MRDLKIIVFILVVCLLHGCATSYQKSGLSGGYSETRLDDNIFKVYFNGNGYTGGEKVADFTLLRSAELTLEHGYKYFAVIDSNSYSTYSAYTTPITSHSNFNAYSYGNSLSGTVSTTTSGGQTYIAAKPGASNLIVCFKEKPTKLFSYDASFIYRNIIAKYKLSKRSNV